jgi:hypothetical protein
MTAKHGRPARPSAHDDGPPTEDLARPGPAALRRPVMRVLGGVRRRAVVIVAVAVLVLAAAVVIGLRMTSDEDAADGTAAEGHQLTYRATSSDGTVVVTYSLGDNNRDGQAKGRSPWSTAVTVTGSIAVLTVTSGSSDRTNSLSCAIEETATGRTLASKDLPPSTDATLTCVTGNLGP